MPKIVSKAQLRWARAASKRGGSEGKAARNAVKEFHGKKARGLPDRKKSRSRRSSRS